MIRTSDIITLAPVKIISQHNHYHQSSYGIYRNHSTDSHLKSVDWFLCNDKVPLNWLRTIKLNKAAEYNEKINEMLLQYLCIKPDTDAISLTSTSQKC